MGSNVNVNNVAGNVNEQATVRNRNKASESPESVTRYGTEERNNGGSSNRITGNVTECVVAAPRVGAAVYLTQSNRQ